MRQLLDDDIDIKLDENGLVEIGVTDQAVQVFESTARIVALEGGTRSGKTIAIAQNFIRLSKDQTKRRKMSIVRKTFPSLRATAMEDYFTLRKEYGVYEKRQHSLSLHNYVDGKNITEFFSLDNEQKVRGRKRNHLWINEANELEYNEFAQLAFRTDGQIFLDFNPVEEDHWIVQKILSRKDVLYIRSNYRMNPFLPVEIVREIEELERADENYWRVFGLGERPVKGAKIYTHYNTVDDFVIEDFDEVIYGLDFGYNNKSAIVRIGVKDNEWTWDELLYKSHLTNSDLKREMHQMRKDGLITSSMQGFADAAEPDRIDELNRTEDDATLGETIDGFNVVKADKSVSGNDAKKNPVGIDFVKSRRLNITKRSVNILSEIGKYSFKTDRNGNILDEPVKVNDHLMDAGRYGEYTFGKEMMDGGVNIRTL